MRIIEMVKEMVPNARPDVINCDFEYAAFATMKTCFPNVERQPLFPTQMWNMYQRTLQGEDRTNNHAEAANRLLRSELGMLHPSIWNFLHGLKRVQKGRDEYFEKLLAGHEPQIK